MGNCCANCVTSTVLGVLLCRHGCKIDSVAKKLAYFPPNPATYKLIPTDGDKYEIHLVDPQLSAWGDAVHAAQKAEAFSLHTSRGSRIPAIFFRQPNSPVVLLFSHSNAMDLGIVLDLLHKLSILLKVNVFAYEYSGYGVSHGDGPNERSTYADITAAYEKVQELGFPPNQIILYGQSIGSGPSCWLASREPVSGLVLHGPLASALSVVSQPACCCRPASMFSCCDMYPNLSRMRRVTCPTLVMHGNEDDVVPFTHGKKLHEATEGNARYPPYWVTGAGHNNLLEIDPEAFLKVFRDFIAHVKAQAKA